MTANVISTAKSELATHPVVPSISQCVRPANRGYVIVPPCTLSATSSLNPSNCVVRVDEDGTACRDSDVLNP